MKKLNPLSFTVLLLFVLNACKKEPKKDINNIESVHKPVFEKIASDHSQITFSNSIKENLATNENLFNYDYFYNGAGAGVEDLNNDGLLDVFFIGNQVNNKLYLNQGDFKFKDISEKANINLGKNWSNGITFVDINEDGWMDIYVSQGGPFPRDKRKNLLYINQKDNTFLEAAESYGLADTGISTQSVFFDADNDGDLDCLVMNESELYGVDPINLNRIVSKDPKTLHSNSSHLYLQEAGKFVDVTFKAGINRAIFGLGVTVSDFNTDGWLDFYIASDYYLPDALFINNQNGTFTDRIKEYTNQISFYGMGMDVADINNDQLQDIFVLDMAANDHVRSKTLMASMNTKRFDYLTKKAGFHHQYMYNTLQLNLGNNLYSNISHATKTASTDWSWSVLLQDFDHDEDKDIYITNGYRRYALDNDLQRKVFEAKQKYRNNIPLAIKKQLYESMPSEKLPNILFENRTKLDFKESAAKWGLADFSFSNGSTIGDLDNDGDMDLIVNNMDEEAFIYKNTTMETGSGNYLRVKPSNELADTYPTITISYNNKKQLIENRRVRGYRSAQENVAHFGIDTITTIDSLVAIWPNGSKLIKTAIQANQTILLEAKDISIDNSKRLTSKYVNNKVNTGALGLNFKHQENTYDDFDTEILLPYKQSNLGPYANTADANNDGLEDIFIGGASGQSAQIFIQTNGGKFILSQQKAFEEDKLYEDIQSTFLDIDLDGDLDLYVVSGGNEFSPYSSYYADRIYLNDGRGNFTKSNQPNLLSNPESGKVVKTIDFDLDGDLDIIVGNRIKPQNYPIPAPSKLYENRKGILVDVTETHSPDLLNFGIINDILVTDFDNDKQMDFIAVGEWTEIGFFKNQNGTFKLASPLSKEENPKGWYFSITETDVNNDNKPDYIVGNIGHNIKFSASETKPFKVYTNDFDDNGTPDIVLSKKYKGQYVPVRGRECSSQQMPFIKEKFETYSGFANANLIDIYGDKLTTAYEATATTFNSLLLLNTNNGFKIQSLPKLAQLHPILSTVNMDLNKDGFEDLIIGGNIYETEVETPRLDAVSGQILLSNGTDNYTVVPQSQTGLYLNGNVKQLHSFQLKEKNYLFSLRNNDTIEVFALDSLIQ
ncbi:VCBS repeat-containing protein [Croceivirga radicis]|uniref:VCBS repeat-containing protein n=1 Tax=Croceivirga radicis TaxID=1929488 RepID=UPI0009B20C18|nr:VCBS repeat-containing protein [Croceivirga radicis]